MFEAASKTYIENLPLELLEVPTVAFRISKKELDAMIDTRECMEKGEVPADEICDIVDGMRRKIDELIEGDFSDGCFAKLGSRSPKDSWLIYSKGMRCKNGKDVLNLFFDSERITDDLYIARANGYLPFIVLRKWVDIDQWREFRCFVKDGKLVGVSQYYYKDYFPEIGENKDSIENAIKNKVEAIRDLLPTDTIIVDVFYNDDGTATLIECNPFGNLTDPCLFDWDKDSFEGYTFRYNIEPKKSVLNDDMFDMFE